MYICVKQTLPGRNWSSARYRWWQNNYTWTFWWVRWEAVVGIPMVQQRQRLSPSSFVPACASVACVCLLGDTQQAHRLNLRSQTVARPAAWVTVTVAKVFWMLSWSLGGLIYHPSSLPECTEGSWDLFQCEISELLLSGSDSIHH